MEDKPQLSKLVESIRKGEVGGNLIMETPFGSKPLVYADYTASARCIHFIEDFMLNQVTYS